MHLVKNSYRLCDFIGLPIDGKKVILRMKVQRYKCKNKNCNYNRQETIPFATGSCSYTHRFARYVVGLNLSIPVFNHFSTRNKIRTAKIDREN